MPKEITITVAEVKDVARGTTSQNRPWTMYSVVATDGSRYTTFEDKYLTAIGKTIQIAYEEKPSTKINPKTNQPYAPSRTIIEPRTAKASGPWSGSLVENLFTQLRRIEDTTAKILEILGESGEKDEDDVSKIPF
jgi:hypothetical protein